MTGILKIVKKQKNERNWEDHRNRSELLREMRINKMGGNNQAISNMEDMAIYLSPWVPDKSSKSHYGMYFADGCWHGWTSVLYWRGCSSVLLCVTVPLHHALCTVLLGSWASLVAQLVKNLPAVWETWVRSLGWEDRRRDLRREGKGYPLQPPGLKNSMDCVVMGLQRIGHDWVTRTALLCS